MKHQTFVQNFKPRNEASNVYIKYISRFETTSLAQKFNSQVSDDKTVSVIHNNLSTDRIDKT
jgi:hypothetical protein